MKTRRLANLKRAEAILLLSPLLCLVLSAAYSARGDGLERKMRSMAGPRAINCGEITANEVSDDEYNRKGDLMEACANRAYDSAQPFYMRQALHMDGIKTNVGFVRTEEGKIYTIVYGLPRGTPFFISRWASIEPLKLSKPRKQHLGQKFVAHRTRLWLFR